MGEAVRLDVAPDGLCVALVLPPELAAQWPAFHQPPHVTLVHAKHAPDEALPAVVDACRAALESMAGETPYLTDVGYFEQPERRIAWAGVSVSPRTAEARERLAEACLAAGVDLERAGEPWVPHATLAQLEPGTDYDGPIPTGSWTIDALEVWRGEDLRIVVRADGVEAHWSSAAATPAEPALDEVAKQDAAAMEADQAAWAEAERHLGSRAASMLGTAVVAASLFGAPAVHTESRVHVTDYVFRADRAEMGSIVEQANGWRRYEVKYSKAGNVQKYNLGGRIVSEYRDPRDVFDPVSMATGPGDPWELRHSKDLLTPWTVRGVARGTILTVEPHPDGVHTWGVSQAWDAGLFDAIDRGTARDVSVAFKCKIDRRPGTTDFNERFDQRQVGIIWNSLASEPRGNAGTAQVLLPRADAAAEFVTRADALLAIATAPAVPSKPVFFDRRHWVPQARAALPPQPETTTRKDTSMKFLELLLAAQGKSAAELAEALGVAEGDLAKLDEDEGLAKKAAEWLAGSGAPPPPAEGDAPPPAPTPAPAADGPTKVKIGDKEFEVPAEVANYISMIEERVNMANSRADAATLAKKAAEAEAAKRQDALTGMVSRADAEQLALARALDGAQVIALARRFHGVNEPAKRQDAVGAELPLTLRDYQYAAIRGAYSREVDPAKRPGVTEGDEIVTRLDAKPEAVRDALIEEYLIGARTIADERANTSQSVRERVAANREEIQQRRQDKAKTGRLRAAAEANAAASAGTPIPSASEGAQ